MNQDVYCTYSAQPSSRFFMWKIKKQYRKKNWDYRNNAFYFITICTKDRRKIFGTIDKINNQVHLSKIGQIVHDEWIKTSKIRPYVHIDEFIIMPDHFHGIIVINHDFRIRDFNVTPRRNEAPPRSYHGNHPYFAKISPKPKSLSSIIGSFKSIVTKKCLVSGLYDHAWQNRFHDRIIRDEFELHTVRRYIKNNPKNWIE